MRFPVHSLRQEFKLFRSNAIQRRNFRRQQLQANGASAAEGLDGEADDRVSLLRDEDLEAQNHVMGRAAAKVDSLQNLHSAHLRRSAFEEAKDDEERIRHVTREITQMITSCHQQIKSLQRITSSLKGRQSIIAKNLVMALSNRLASLSEAFRKDQNAYLKKIEAREQSTKHYFDQDLLEDATTEIPLGPPGFESPSSSNGGQSMSMQQLLLLEDDTKRLREREVEIQGVVSSIAELNTIFKDLAVMVSEQGTIIDRIDYNIEMASIKVEDGLEQLKQAERIQRRDKKLLCILIEAGILLFLLFLLMLKVSL